MQRQQDENLEFFMGEKKFLKARPNKLGSQLFWNLINYFLPILLALGGIQSATQRFVRLTKWSVALNGRPLVNAKIFGHSLVVFNPIIYLGNVAKWTFARNLTKQNEQLANLLTKTFTPAGICCVVAVALAVVITATRSFAANTKGIHGTARWATWRELRKTGLMSNKRCRDRLLQTSGLVCGQLQSAKVWADKSKKALTLKMEKDGEAPLVCHTGKANTLLLAPTGTGKGVGVIIPTLLSYMSSMVVFDPKGENFNLTAGWRRQFSRILKFAPCDFDTVGFNPVMAVKDDKNAFSDMDLISSMFFPASDKGGEGNSEFFNQSAKDIMTTVLVVHFFAR